MNKRRRLALARERVRELRAHLRERRSIAHLGKALRVIRDSRIMRLPPPPPPRQLAEIRSGLPLGAEPLGGYLTQSEALQALEDFVGRDKDKGSGIATGLAIGLATVAVLGLGVVVCYLLFRKKDGEGSGFAPQPLGAPQVVINGLVPATSTNTALAPIRSQIQPLGYYEDPEQDDGGTWVARPQTRPLIRTLVLPSLATAGTRAVRLINATHVPYKVIVRVVAPAGGFAALSFEPNELNQPDVSTIPSGDTFLMPAGAQQEFALAPHQALFGKGSVANVVVSVIASETNG